MMRLFLGTLLLTVVGTGLLGAQTYPYKPIRILTANIGGGSDIIARIITQEISGPLSQPVIVDNRPNGPIPVEIVARAPPDGYTLLVLGNTIWNASLVRKLSYDPVKDFAPVTIAARYPSLVVVHPSVGVHLSRN